MMKWGHDSKKDEKGNLFIPLEFLKREIADYFTGMIKRYLMGCANQTITKFSLLKWLNRGEQIDDQ